MNVPEPTSTALLATGFLFHPRRRRGAAAASRHALRDEKSGPDKGSETFFSCSAVMLQIGLADEAQLRGDGVSKLHFGRKTRNPRHDPQPVGRSSTPVRLSLDVSGTSPLRIHPMHRKTFSPGDIIFRQGDRSEEAYWIVSGKVEISIDTPAGPDVLTTLDEGEIFGEMGMIDDQPRSATARVMTPTEVDVIDVADFQQQIVRREDRLMRYLDTLFDRLRTTNALLRTHLGKRWAEARLASGPPAERFHEVIPTLTILSTEASAGLYPDGA